MAYGTFIASRGGECRSIPEDITNAHEPHIYLPISTGVCTLVCCQSPSVASDALAASYFTRFDDLMI